MNHGEPRVSIGLPIFNGEAFLKEAIDSILAQSYSDFELIISDNGSTDLTEQICHEYASKDSRIRYYRNKKNMGAAWNHNRVFELSSGEYFKWTAYDDVLAKDFLLRCVEVLDQNPSIVLCHCETGRINETGRALGKYEYGARMSSLKEYERFGDIVSMRNYAWLLLLGVIRSSFLRETRLFGNYIGADRNLMAELSLYGPIYQIPDVLFFRREHAKAYTNKEYSLRDYREKLGWWIGTTPPRLVFPYWQIFLEYFKSLNRSPLKSYSKHLCRVQVVKWFFREGWVFMLVDLGVNLFGHSKIYDQLVPMGKLLSKRLSV